MRPNDRMQLRKDCQMTLEQRQQKLDQLLLAYQRYFDIQRDVEIEGDTFGAAADFHSTSEKYVLVKKAKLWSLESNEYAYFYMTERLDKDELERIQKKTLDAGLKKVVPHSEHMYSYVTLIILADEVDEAAAEALKKIRFEKNYRLSLHGWMEFRIAAISFSDGKIVTNRAGKGVREILEQNLQSKKRGEKT